MTPGWQAKRNNDRRQQRELLRRQAACEHNWEYRHRVQMSTHWRITEVCPDCLKYRYIQEEFAEGE